MESGSHIKKRMDLTNLVVLTAVFLIVHIQGIQGSQNQLSRGLLLCYEDKLEVLDTNTGETVTKYDTNASYIPSIAVTKVGDETVDVLALDLVDGEHSKLELFTLNGAGMTSKSLREGFKSIVDEMAYDWSTNRVYLLSGSNKEVLDISLSDGSDSELRFESYTKGIATDSCRSDVYWSEWRRNETVIVRYDGENRTTVASGGLNQPRNLVIRDRTLYWLSKTRDGIEIESMDLDSLKRTTVCTHSNRQGPRVSVYSMAVDDDAIYWSDWHNMAVWKVEFGGENCHPKVLKSMGSTRPLSVATLTSFQRCNDLPPVTPSSFLKDTTVESSSSPFDRRFPQDCTNYCIEHSVQASDYVGPSSSLTLQSKCFETSMEIPICRCQSGFKGSRCQEDPCHNFCLNGGKCLRFPDPETRPQCRCSTGFAGDRCQAVAVAAAAQAVKTADVAEDDNSTYLYLFTTAVISLGILVLVVIAVVLDNFRLRKQVNNLPDVVKKGRTRVISGSSSRSRSSGRKRKDHCNSNEDLKSSFIQNQSCCGGGSANDGVVLDLEDCCQMTVCDTPCVEASFRKPTHRKSRLHSVSKVEDGSNFDFDNDDKQQLIY